jgi:hypothetical protein
MIFPLPLQFGQIMGTAGLFLFFMYFFPLHLGQGAAPMLFTLASEWSCFIE